MWFCKKKIKKKISLTFFFSFSNSGILNLTYLISDSSKEIEYINTFLRFFFGLVSIYAELKKRPNIYINKCSLKTGFVLLKVHALVCLMIYVIKNLLYYNYYSWSYELLVLKMHTLSEN